MKRVGIMRRKDESDAPKFECTHEGLLETRVEGPDGKVLGFACGFCGKGKRPKVPPRERVKRPKPVELDLFPDWLAMKR